jgi:hypothetical protein
MNKSRSPRVYFALVVGGSFAVYVNHEASKQPTGA